MNDIAAAAPNRVTIRVWGDFACFTRPEMKVERVSYPVITPSAARGILEAIYWEPQMYYLIDSIHIIRRGRWISFRRNEVICFISLDNAKSWMNGTRKVSPIQAGGGAADGTQRNMLALQGVEYLITAEVRLTSLARQPRCNLAKYLDQIKRRAAVGKCFHRPAFGVREFDANFALEENADTTFARRQRELGAEATPLIHYEPLGLMLYDVFDHNQREQGFRWLREEEIKTNRQHFEEEITGLKKTEQNRRRKVYAANERCFEGQKIQPHSAFFQAEIRDSVLQCHPDAVEILLQDMGGEH
ncbi:type I-C CRISPR-associated protein Cas5c [Desulfobulbus alkaliphilus]|uniref:type I-C CRISPR-associated protein Cas5c n=1 Tax=Desulfobulbus alkaliphilus TaxID=869814 RepID=UPI00196403C2|nr:type I-C CRISPR-associated protein Cas5c [Desulfobulbus alkaliphilus]MBM9537323.1 type I-C CRISPR-associated protein Cas5 [Desulfobulbus alkaliphilus]